MPRLIVATDWRYLRARDGSVHCPSGAHAYPFWRRYLEVFDEVVVIMRLFESVATELAAPLVGPGVGFAALPAYEGPRGLVRAAPDLLRAIGGIVRPDDVLVGRVPGIHGFLLAEWVAARGRPFGVEVLADPARALAPEVIRHAGAAVFRQVHTRALRRLCRRATAASYVTLGVLQGLYPPGPHTFAIHCSDVELGGRAMVTAPRRWATAPTRPRLVTVGTLEQLYKGTDVLLRALARVVADGVDAHLTIVGEGRFRGHLEELCAQLGLDERVTFTGMLPFGDAVRERLDAADLFVLPSLTEGLPRALIEAMARGMPCIGSEVGGVPELLQPADLFPPGDAVALARAIAAIVRDPSRLERSAAANLAGARRFTETERRWRHVAFLEHLRSAARVRRGWL